MEYNLPRKYLSYSQFALWNSSKESYRKRYYLGEKPFETKETAFGRKTDDHLDNGGTIEGVINYGNPQFEINYVYKGIPIFGKLDDFCTKEFRILERKTGHKNPKGIVPWDAVKVRKHKQLTFYSAMIELQEGKVHPEVILQWLETDFKDKHIEFDGHVLKSNKSELVLTGKVATFKRRIPKWERVKMLKDIIKCAKEISEDYTLWQNK